MVDIKYCLLVLLLVTLVASFEENFHQPLSHSRRHSAAKNKYLQQLELSLRHQQVDVDVDEFKAYRRSFLQHAGRQEEYLELRATASSAANNTGIVITLQNRAIMNTRLRVLYTDPSCVPFLVESATLWAFQTKSVTLPADAGHVKVIVQKDLIFGTWRTVYNTTLTTPSQCVRITGTVFSSTVRKCP